MSLDTIEEKKLSKYHIVALDQDYLNNIHVTISLQKQGRHNLTSITGISNKLFDLKLITSKLKKLCGGGGAYKEITNKDGTKKEWVISIQGDCRIEARAFLAEKLLISEFNIRIMGV